MNKILSILCFLAVSAFALSQDLNATYHEGNSFLKFRDNRLAFDMAEMGSISNSAGEGAFRQVGDFIVVDAQEYSGEKTVMETRAGSKKDTIVIKITDHRHTPIQGALVESLNAKGKTLLSGASGSDGRLLFLHDPKISQFRVFNMGSNGLTFNYVRSNDFVVKLSDRTVVENKQVVFKINQIDEETISALLLSTDFSAGKDEQKALEKLDERARKRNFLPKRFKKEYVPYVRPSN